MSWIIEAAPALHYFALRSNYDPYSTGGDESVFSAPHWIPNDDTPLICDYLEPVLDALRDIKTLILGISGYDMPLILPLLAPLSHLHHLSSPSRAPAKVRTKGHLPSSPSGQSLRSSCKRRRCSRWSYRIRRGICGGRGGRGWSRRWRRRGGSRSCSRGTLELMSGGYRVACGLLGTSVRNRRVGKEWSSWASSASPRGMLSLSANEHLFHSQEDHLIYVIPSVHHSFEPTSPAASPPSLPSAELALPRAQGHADDLYLPGGVASV